MTDRYGYLSSALILAVAMAFTAPAGAAAAQDARPAGREAARADGVEAAATAGEEVATSAQAPSDRLEGSGSGSGFRWVSVDDQFEIRLIGRLHYDFGVAIRDERLGVGDRPSLQAARRTRLGVQGRMYERIDYKIELDFASSTPARDMYVGVRDWPVGFRFGHFKEPFSLEELTSSNHIIFMERSILNTMAPSRNVGLMLSNSFGGGRGSWAGGVFRDSNGFAGTPGDNFNLAGRLTYAPVLSSDQSEVLHFGVGVQRREIEGNYSASARPGARVHPGLISLSIPAASSNSIAVEAGANLGSLNVQAEYMSTSVEAIDGSDPRIEGYYVQASLFLTGERHRYSGGTWSGPRQKSNFPGGAGAVQVATRYARLDLTDVAAESAGELWVLTAGLNWYWNPNLRWMLNYDVSDRADLAGSDGPVSALSMRMRVFF